MIVAIHENPSVWGACTSRKLHGALQPSPHSTLELLGLISSFPLLNTGALCKAACVWLAGWLAVCSFLCPSRPLPPNQELQSIETKPYVWPHSPNLVCTLGTQNCFKGGKFFCPFSPRYNLPTPHPHFHLEEGTFPKHSSINSPHGIHQTSRIPVPPLINLPFPSVP